MEKTLTKNSGRIYSADLVKIIAMFFVLLIHLISVGRIIDGATENSLLFGILSGIEGVAYACVNLFALATGFISSQKKVRYSRLFELWLQALFICLACLAVVYLAGGEITGRRVAYSTLVLTLRNYWYLNEYIAMMLISPVLNTAVKKLSGRSMGFVIAAFAVIASFYPTIAARETLSKGYTFIWLSFLYVVGGYIRKYDIHKSVSKIFASAVYILSTAAQGALIFVSKRYDLVFFGDKDYSHIHSWYNNAFVLVSSVSLFILLLGIEIKSDRTRKAVAAVSGVSFTVYLVHGSPAIWQYIVNNYFFIGHMNTAGSLASIFILAVGIYAASILIGFAQARLFKILHIDRLCEKLELAAVRLYNFLFETAKKRLNKKKA